MGVDVLKGLQTHSFSGSRWDLVVRSLDASQARGSGALTLVLVAGGAVWLIQKADGLLG